MESGIKFKYIPDEWAVCSKIFLFFCEGCLVWPSTDLYTDVIISWPDYKVLKSVGSDLRAVIIPHLYEALILYWPFENHDETMNQYSF